VGFGPLRTGNLIGTPTLGDLRSPMIEHDIMRRRCANRWLVTHAPEDQTGRQPRAQAGSNAQMLRHSPGCGVRLATEEPRSQSPPTITAHNHLDRKGVLIDGQQCYCRT
jgi:hypothetical protein